MYVDDLNICLSAVKVGSHIVNQADKNFTFVDDMALTGPSDVAVNDLLKMCKSLHPNITFYIA